MSLLNLFQYFIKDSNIWGDFDMRILIDDELLKFSYIYLARMYLGSGYEARVYRHKDEALKIYKTYCVKIRLDEIDTLKLSMINTNRLLLPRRIIRNPDTGHFIGYTTKFLYSSKIEDILNMQMGQFMSELGLLRDDVFNLGDYGVKVTDFNLRNTVYSDGIYLVDPGSYWVRDKDLSSDFREKIKRDNLANFNWYVKSSLLKGVKLDCDLEDIVSEYPDRDICYIGDVIGNSFRAGETVKEYIKRSNGSK